MARTLLVVLVLAFCAAVSADRYAFNQVDEIIARVEVCLKPVPEDPRAFYTPATTCQDHARYWSLEDGDSKESLAYSVPACLRSRSVDSAIVATVKQCLAVSLAKDIQPALEEADYSDVELDEIDNRIRVCLNMIPTDYATSDCRRDAIENARLGYPKETLVNFIIPCLKSLSIDSYFLKQVDMCLTSNLREPLRN